MSISFPTSAKEFPFPASKVEEVNITDTINTALGRLLEADILSLPVYDHKQKIYRGWFSISDLIPVFLALDSHIKRLPSEELTVENVIKLSKEFPFDQVSIGSDSTMDRCFASGLSPMFPWTPFNLDSPMSKIIKSLNSDKVKRVPILDGDGRAVKVISQSAIIQFVNEKISELVKNDKNFKLPPVFEKSAEELGLLKDVIAVDESTPVADALELMLKTKHSCVGILSEGNLFTCVTTKDLLKFKSLQNVALNRLKIEKDSRDFDEGIKEKSHGELSEPELHAGRALADLTVTDFVSYVRINQKSSKARAPVVKVDPSTSLMKIIAKLSKSKVHRLFIVQNKKPVGVVSVRDVVRIMFS